jgi:hypothetical protein
MAVPKPAISELYLIMHDSGASERDRINSAVSASRVEPLTMPGEEPPPAVKWLRKMVDDLSAPTGYRRECAAALAYWERRAKKVELAYNVADDTERRRQWRSLVNGAIRLHLAKIGKWPERKDVLMGPDDLLEVPAANPEVVLSAILLGSSNRAARRRQKAIDERATELWSGSEAERTELIRPVARLAHERLMAFGLAE